MPSELFKNQKSQDMGPDFMKCPENIGYRLAVAKGFRVNGQNITD